jgi:hypothetical protein
MQVSTWKAQNHQKQTDTKLAAVISRKPAGNLHFSCSQADSTKSTRINALRGPQSSTYIQYIGKKSKEANEHQSRTHWQATSRDHDLATHQHAQAGS